MDKEGQTRKKAINMIRLRNDEEEDGDGSRGVLCYPEPKARALRARRGAKMSAVD